ncbi:hypothetical protein [uncultured Hyphomonas sp.]|uniref:hypothetical protein n=1 Tax=uncultured Hyphomonas sp. TaxID=225298 RepID=UPI00374942DB
MPFRAFLAAILAAGSAAFVAEAQGRIGLQPASVELETDAGQPMRQVVTVANLDRAHPVSVSLALADWAYDADGAPIFTPAGENDTSAAGWTRHGAPTLSLAPGQSKQVVIQLSTPDQPPRTGDYRVALLASSVMKDTEGRWQKNQTASLVSLTIGKASSRPRIEASRLTVTDAGDPAIALDFSNTGNAHARLDGVIEVRSGTEIVITHELSDVIVPEKGVRSLIVPLGQSVPAGADIEVRLVNQFAPQTTRGEKALPVHKVKTEAEAATEVAELTLPVGGLK